MWTRGQNVWLRKCSFCKISVSVCKVLLRTIITKPVRQHAGLNISVKDSEIKLSLSLIYWRSVREQDGDTVRGRDCWLDLWLWQIWGSFHWAVPSCKFPVFVRAAIKTNPWPGQGCSFQRACREGFFSWQIACPFNTAKDDRQEKIKVYTCVYINLPLHQIYSYANRQKVVWFYMISYKLSESGGGTVRKSTLWWVPHVFMCMASTSDYHVV